MMLTALNSVQRSPGLWRWALIVLFAAGIVLGLLSMHTLSAGHGAPPAATAADHGHAGAMGEQPGGDVGCADCGSPGGHESLTMVCVLGLLVTLLLIGRSTHGPLHVRGPAAPAIGLPIAVPSVARPPSLDELSISRT